MSNNGVAFSRSIYGYASHFASTQLIINKIEPSTGFAKGTIPIARAKYDCSVYHHRTLLILRNEDLRFD